MALMYSCLEIWPFLAFSINANVCVTAGSVLTNCRLPSAAMTGLAIAMAATTAAANNPILHLPTMIFLRFHT
jgi:hypothetical protein